MTTVDSSGRKFFFGEHIRCPLFKHVADFGCAKAARGGVCDSHKAGFILEVVRF